MKPIKKKKNWGLPKKKPAQPYLSSAPYLPRNYALNTIDNSSYLQNRSPMRPMSYKQTSIPDYKPMQLNKNIYAPTSKRTPALGSSVN
jgi:hypothetical protein